VGNWLVIVVVMILFLPPAHITATSNASNTNQDHKRNTHANDSLSGTSERAAACFCGALVTIREDHPFVVVSALLTTDCAASGVHSAFKGAKIAEGSACRIDGAEG